MTVLQRRAHSDQSDELTEKLTPPLFPSLSSAKQRRLLQEDVSAGSWLKYLPASISEFQPVLRTLAQPIQREHLQDALQQWIDT